jgi:hypothetical protein
MVVKINRKLNIVFDVETDRGIAHVHSVPISRAVFEDHFMVISRTFSAFYTNGFGPLVGPRIAKLMLLREAGTLGEEERVKSTFLPEIERLTTVLIPGERKWESLPLGVAHSRKIIDDDTLNEVEGCLVYFTLASAMNLKAELTVTLEALRQFWNGATTSLSAMEYMNSLPTLTPDVTTGEKPTLAVVGGASSIPT